MKITSTYIKKLTGVLVLSMLSVQACSQDKKDATNMQESQTAQAAADMQEAPELSDAEIASVAVVANKIDINHAKIALERSENAAIRNFAQTMIDDHKAVIQKAVDLVTKLGVTPKDNAVSQSLMKRAEEVTAKLKSIDSSEFDAYYISNEVAYHQAVIDAAKTLLIPQAQNVELKALLQSVAPVLVTHKGHAKEVQDQLSM